MDTHPNDKILIELGTFLPKLDAFTVEKLKDDYLRASQQSLDSSSQLSKLPLEIVYLAEGNANVVYKLLFPGKDILPGDNNAHSNLSREGRHCSFVLRVRKDTPFGVPYSEVISYYSTEIKPLFHSNDLVSQSLIPIPTSTLHALDDSLRALEASRRRPLNRHGTYLVTDDPHALLMEDMSASALSPTAQTIELKPKWLLQSSSAPRNSLRCRTCALQAMRRADEAFKAKSDSKLQALSIDPAAPPLDPNPQPPCPLSLLSSSHTTLKSFLAVRSTSSHDAVDATTLSSLTAALLHHPTILRLRAAQARHNAVGLSDIGTTTFDPLGMTLRDCTLFIRFDTARNNEKGEDAGLGAMRVEVKLADLDEKSPVGGKLEKWIDTERRLVEEGWYEGRDFLRSSSSRSRMDGVQDESGGGGGGGGELRLCDLG